MSEIQYVSGDLFEAVKAPHLARTTIIPHVCNSQGAWGAGFVVPLAKAYPQAREEYLKWHKVGYFEIEDYEKIVTHHFPFEIGQTQFVVGQTDPEVVVANMIAQHMGGVRPLMYNHLAKCMDRVAQEALKLKARIMAPMFGSMLAGGNWEFIEALIQDCWLDEELDVTIFYLPGKTPPGWTPPVKD